MKNYYQSDLVIFIQKWQNIENIGITLRRTSGHREHTNTKRLMTRNIA